jgi:alginate export protein
MGGDRRHVPGIVTGGKGRGGRALTAALLLVAALGVDNASAAGSSCPVKMFRWEEDCSNLRSESASPLGLDRLRFIALNETGSVWLTLGAEYRFKTEYLDAPDYGLRSVDQAYTAIGQRVLLHADLHTRQGFRAFVQLSAASDAGRKPIGRPFDRSKPDVAQAFVDLPLLNAAVLRLGRQELDTGGNRLISVREAGNLRLAFDMARVAVTVAGVDAVAFYGRPVLNRLNGFDDRGNPAEKLLGGWLQHKLSTGPAAPLVNLFFFSRDRAHAVYEQGAASDARRTLGIRFSGADPSWDYAVQAARQYGSFGSADIDAFGAAGDVGWHPALPGRPRIAASFGYASGDHRPGDRTLGTFDVLYPNLGYFTDAPVYYPGNTVDAQPNMTLNLMPTLSVRWGSDVIFRVSKRDAVYGPPGIPVLPGQGTGPSYVTTLSYLRSDWSITPHASLTLAFVHGDAGALIRAAGGHSLNYGELTLDLHM